MKSPKYLVETQTGSPVFTTGSKVTLEDTGRRAEIFGSERDVIMTKRHYEARLKQPLKLVESGIAEYSDV